MLMHNAVGIARIYQLFRAAHLHAVYMVLPGGYALEYKNDQAAGRALWKHSPRQSHWQDELSSQAAWHTKKR
jgi:hypothetical protein